MCTEFEENRKFLADLLFSKERFTIEEIEREYKEAKGTFVVDGQLTIRGYIKHLRDMGILESVGLHYRMTKETPVPAV